MATTITAADLTVTVTESYTLNGVAYGNTINKSFSSNGQVLQRIMNVSTSDPAVLNLGQQMQQDKFLWEITSILELQT